jgi:peptidoglycan/xylan/chitin deacetylase (PgdA/CDA1 family)
MPALIFVVADVVGRREPFFQERLVGAWRAGRLDARHAANLWRDAGGGPARVPTFAGRDDLEPLRQLIALLEALAPGERDRVLGGLGPAMDDGVCHMATADQLRTLAGQGVAIGAHGKTHTPLTRAEDLDAELAGARAALAGHVGAPPSAMSCPHGAHDAGIVEAAHAAGYELVFTSVPVLPPAGGIGPAAVGRVGFTGEAITDSQGRFAPEPLALHLFRKPHAA